MPLYLSPSLVELAEELLGHAKREQMNLRSRKVKFHTEHGVMAVEYNKPSAKDAMRISLCVQRLAKALDALQSEPEDEAAALDRIEELWCQLRENLRPYMTSCSLTPYQAADDTEPPTETPLEIDQVLELEEEVLFPLGIRVTKGAAPRTLGE